MRRFSVRCWWVAVCVLAALHGTVMAAEERPAATIVASIRPLALLAKELLLDVPEVRVTTLLSPSASPHHYALRVSDRQRLADADLVLWVGPGLERFLSKAVESRGDGHLALAELPGLHWPQGTHGDHHPGRDPHIWLNPENGILMVKALVARLQLLKVPGSEGLGEKAAVMIRRLEALDSEVAMGFAPIKHKGFVVFHQGYDHWVGHYGLNQLASVSRYPEQRLGARHIYRLRERFKGKAQCLFVEANASGRTARNLSRQLDLRLTELDPLGVQPSIHSYSDLLRNLAASMRPCLSS